MTASPEPPVDRPAGRVLLVDATDRILLFRGRDPGRPGLDWWFTPGGGLDDGETSAEGAARELREETGYPAVAADLGPIVFTETIDFEFDHVRYRQTQDFYLLRVPQWDVDTRGFSPEERSTVQDHRWWTLTDLAATTETVYPEGLPELLSGLLRPSTRAAGAAASCAPGPAAAPGSGGAAGSGAGPDSVVALAGSPGGAPC